MVILQRTLLDQLPDGSKYIPALSTPGWAGVSKYRMCALVTSLVEWSAVPEGMGSSDCNHHCLKAGTVTFAEGVLGRSF